MAGDAVRPAQFRPVTFLERIGVRRSPDISAAFDGSTAVTRSAATLAPTLAVASPWALPGQLASVVVPDVFGTDAALPLTRARAMSVPSVARARHILVGSIARIPLRAYPTKLDTDPLPDEQQPVWIDRTDSVQPPWHRMAWTVDDLLFYGLSLWRRTNSVQEGRERPLHCDRIPYESWSIDGSGHILVNGRAVSRSSVHMIYGPHEGLLTFAASTIRHAANLQAASDKAASTPAAQIDLHQTQGDPLDDTAIDNLIRRWAAARRGENGGVSYSNPSIDVRELGSVEAHLLIEGRNAAAVDVARHVGLPASRIDASTEASLTYSTTRDNARELIDFGLSLYTGPIAASLSVDDLTPHGTRLAFDLDEWLPPEGTAVALPAAQTVNKGDNAQ